MANPLENIQNGELTKGLTKFNDELVRTGKEMTKVLETAKKLDTDIGKLNKSTKTQAEKQKTLNENTKKATSLQQERVKIEKQIHQVFVKSIAQTEKNNRVLQKGKVLTQQRAKDSKDMARLLLAEKGSTKQLSAVVTILNTRLSKVNQTTADGKKRADLLRSAINRLNGKITAQGTAMAKQKRNIGNYGSALQGIGIKAKAAAVRFAGALGLTSAIFLFINAIKNTFRRIRQFDAAMQNIAGILGVTRSELSGVEKTIKKVASQSIKTSNEVAKLAEVLFTLGKTREEVIDMLEPVNNLAIGLQTTSENAAELLGQTLNAFGKGSESAAEFADIIANMRTSTALNFQRIQEALGFLAPTANALNLTLGKTGALIGILQDNGVKASRAGALLNTSFARLVGKGLDLNGALELINTSTDKVKTSSDLFGKRAFGLGLILADNVDRIKSLGDEFDNLSGGSLKVLTDEQLKSMDSQLKILDSTWEKFVLDIDSGSGVIAVSVRGLVKLLITAIDGLQFLGKSNKEIFDAWRKDAQEIAQEDALGQSLINDRKEVENIAKSLIDKGVPALEANNRAVNLLRVSYFKLIGFGVENVDQIEKQIAALDKLIVVTVEKGRVEEETEKERKKREKAEKDASIEKEKFILFERDNRLKAAQDLIDIRQKEEELADKSIDAELKRIEDESIEELRIDALKVDQKIKNAIRLQNEEKKIEEQRRQQKLQSLAVIASVFGQESAIGKAAIALQQADAIKSNLISLGVISAKQAEGTAKSAAAAPFPFNIPLIAGTIAQFIGIFKTFQKSKVPAFADGTEDAPGGIAELAERGKEMIENPDGKIWMAENRGLYNLEKGSKVHTNKETQAKLDNGDVVKELRLTRKAINNIPQPIYKNGSKIAERRGNYWVNYRNSKNRLN